MMEVIQTILKAFFLVALPITLAVYACMYVGARTQTDLAQRPLSAHPDPDQHPDPDRQPDPERPTAHSHADS